MSKLRRQAALGHLRVGTRARITRTFTEKDVVLFGEITRDDNPVHSEDRWCQAKGYRGPICHGLLVGSMLCEPGGQWGWLATEMSFRFRRPVYIGDTITCELTITAIDERQKATGECVFQNELGDVVLTAELRGFLPTEEEARLLSRLLDDKEHRG